MRHRSNAKPSPRLAEVRRDRLAAARVIACHTAEEWEAMLAWCDWRCCRCGSEECVQKDHIVPLFRGGSDGIENLQPLCRPCNAGKTADETDHRPRGWPEFIQSTVPHVRAA